MLTKHSYSGETFKTLFDNFKPSEEKTAESQMVKVASGCVDCPYAGKVSADVCNRCKYASGISYVGGVPQIKCSYQKEGMIKEALSIQGIHWPNEKMASQDQLDQVHEDIKTKILEELKYAARNIGVKLAQDQVNDFANKAFKNRLSGKKLERAARSFVIKLEERVSPAERRKNSGKLDEIFAAVSRNAKTIISGMSSPDVGDNDGAGCSYLGSKRNPNTIWDSEALKKAAQTATADELMKKQKKANIDAKQAIKDSYWQALHEKLSSKGLVPSPRVHSLATEPSAGFNTKLAANAMGIFGDHKEFENIPKKTTGEEIAQHSEERATKKAKENKEVHIEAAQSAESENWLFR